MRACVRLDDGECSDMFDVEQGLWQGCVPAPILFNMFLTAVLCVAKKRFTADASWCKSNERRKGGERGGGHGPEESMDRKRRRRPRRCGESCTLMMQALYRDPQKGWRR